MLPELQLRSIPLVRVPTNQFLSLWFVSPRTNSNLFIMSLLRSFIRKVRNFYHNFVLTGFNYKSFLAHQNNFNPIKINSKIYFQNA